MIEIELPCCGDAARLTEMVDEIRCEACGIVAELAPDPPPVRAGAVAVAAGAVAAPALAA